MTTLRILSIQMMLVSPFLSGDIRNFKASIKIIRKKYTLRSPSVSRILIKLTKYNFLVNHKNQKIKDTRMSENFYTLKTSVFWHLYYAFSKPQWKDQGAKSKKLKNSRKKLVTQIYAVSKRSLQEFKNITIIKYSRKYYFSTSTKVHIMSPYQKYF